MGSKHPRMPWYSASLHPVTSAYPAYPLDAEAPAADPSASSTEVEVPLNPDDPDFEVADEEIDPDSPSGIPVSGIDQFTIKEMKWFMLFPPSEL